MTDGLLSMWNNRNGRDVYVDIGFENYPEWRKVTQVGLPFFANGTVSFVVEGIRFFMSIGETVNTGMEYR